MGDFDCTGIVDGADLTLLLGAWATTNSEYDLTGDGAGGWSRPDAPARFLGNLLRLIPPGPLISDQ